MKITRPRQITAARRALNYTQADLAQLVGCTQQYVSRIESGKERHCSERFAHELMQRLQLDPTAVFDHVPDVTHKRRRTKSAGRAA